MCSLQFLQGWGHTDLPALRKEAPSLVEWEVTLSPAPVSGGLCVVVLPAAGPGNGLGKACRAHPQCHTGGPPVSGTRVAAAGPPASQGSPQTVTSTPSERLCPLPWEGAKLLLLSLGSPHHLSWATPSPQRTWMQRRRQCCSGSTVSWRIRLVRMGWKCGGVGTSSCLGVLLMPSS